METQQSHGQAVRRPIAASDFKDALVLAGMTPEQAEQRARERSKSRSRGREVRKWRTRIFFFVFNFFLIVRLRQ